MKRITIEAEKIIEQGVQMVKVTKLEALTEKEVPLRYQETKGTKEAFFYSSMNFGKEHFHGNYHYVINNRQSYKGDFFVVGERYTKEAFEKRIHFIRMAGDRLQQINKQLKEENKKWRGHIEIVI